ncbi:MAG: 2Fe-2S iron-sulfur cluster binding domain-containing protein [Clostridiales bacterium]|jgi:NADP-reducing hydrogenase subunit HndD|nr:2Fe-2S iron-sulfur cluster binding domain-containing protein [Clostridiales bacterium]
MDKVNLTIDGIKVTVPADYTVLEAAREAGINIPTLCYLKDVQELGACRMCLVEGGGRGLQAACVLPVSEGMNIKTNTPTIRKARRINLELLLSNHNRECTGCIRNRNCELQQLSNEYGVRDFPYDGPKTESEIDDISPSIVRDNSKCILCRRCIAVCNDVQNIGAINVIKRGMKTHVGSVFEKPLASSPCIACGQCIIACPTGALHEKDSTKAVWEALSNPDLHVVVQPAPAVRAALGEEFGLPVGTRVTGKLAAALRRLGFDKVFDTDFAADLTIIEEGYELIDRLTNNGVLPMITSCSPGWINFCETFYPEFIPNLSSCKSPHEMGGALVKSYYAEKNGIDPKKIYMVSVMPCTAKKYEAQRSELSRDDMQDVDAVITTRELAAMIRTAGIDFVRLPDEDFDDLMGESTGAAVIFGVTGGVMEAALRTVYEVVTGKELNNVNLTSVRGLEGVREAEVDLDGRTVRIAVANGTGNASRLLESIKAGEKQYDFIEIMGCPGGCITGGGQPIINATELCYINPKELRAKALYTEDEAKTIRKSHQNKSVKKLYDEFLGSPNSHKAHELLHTHYKPRAKYR